MIGLSPSLFQELFADLDLGVLMLDSARRIRAVNPAYCRMAGVTSQDVVGRDCLHTHHCWHYAMATQEHLRSWDYCREHCPFSQPSATSPSLSRMIWLEVQGSPRLPCIQAYVSLSREGPEECGLLIFLIPLGGLHDAVIDGQRLHKELSLAAQLQETLEPPRAEWDPSLEVAMYSRSFRPVGGDLHESWLSSAKESLYYVADISGKSLPAALFLPGVRHRVHKWLSQGTATDLELLSSDLHDWLPDSMFVALTLVRRKVDRDIVMINAGGPEPWLYQKRIDQAGPMADCLGVALGIQPATEYREVFARLCPGDIVTLWTDGVTEAMERAGLAPGHFLQELGRSLPGTLQQGLDDMVGRLRTSDDATVMALRETA